MPEQRDFTRRRRDPIGEPRQTEPDDPTKPFATPRTPEGEQQPDQAEPRPVTRDDVDPADEVSTNDHRRDRTRGQRVMMREMEQQDAGRVENLLADTPPDADHASEALDLARTWATRTPARHIGVLQRSTSTIAGQVAADDAEITPLSVR